YLKRGNLLRRHGDWALARADFKRVRKIQPDNEIIDWFDGRLAVESGQAEEGVRLLDRFLSANPNHAIALQNRAQGHLALGQPLLAAGDFARVIESSAKPAPALFSANAMALVQAGPEYFYAASEVVDDGLNRFPTEISLAEIGVDLSLAQARTTRADDLIDRLPATIQTLPQWQMRSALLDCLTGHEEVATLWFGSSDANSANIRQRRNLLEREWIDRLSVNASPENCQQASIEILRRR
ncbi:MAG: hypothetical protein KJO80_01110, partial [Gammaproteobacteria bacterium]|nr:hypothetical protein [Gammaproteobacteria bacterium]